MTSHTSESNRLAFRETDEAGNPTATYIYSGDVASSVTSSKIPAGRVDVIVSGLFLLSYWMLLVWGFPRLERRADTVNSRCCLHLAD